MGARERRRAALEGELVECAALEQTAAVVDDVAVTAEIRALGGVARTLDRESRAGLGDPPPTRVDIGPVDTSPAIWQDRRDGTALIRAVARPVHDRKQGCVARRRETGGASARGRRRSRPSVDSAIVAPPH